jgi:rRNA maturation RNase YbeY
MEGEPANSPAESNLTVNVFNRQRGLRLSTAGLKAFARSLAKRLELTSGFSVVLVSDAAMCRFNSRFRGKDYPTDVLAFPAGKGEGNLERYLGDVIISVNRANAQRSDSLEQELKILALHGLLHLLGYDHEADEGEMGAYEIELRKEFALE